MAAFKIEDNPPWIAIDEIKPHPDNPREHTKEQVKRIARSIKKLDWGRPIIISIDNYILAGEGAYLASKDILKLEKVPYRRMKWQHDSPEALSYMAADNRLGEESYWKYEKLHALNEKVKLQGFDNSLLGFEDIELQEIKDKLETPDFQPLPPEEQPRLDEKNKIKCPMCGHEFEP